MDAGIRKNLAENKCLTFMTLTSSPESPEDISRSFYIMKRQLQRDYKQKIGWDYIRVKTNEGPVHVLHCITNWRYIPQAKLSLMWDKIHGAKIVDIRTLWYGRGLKNYLNKYLSNQGRLSSSRTWVYQGWRVEYHRIATRLWFHYMPCLTRSPICLQSYIRTLYYYYKEDILINSLMPLN
jgi:hypothetical protein